MVTAASTPATRLLHTQVLDTDYYAAQVRKGFPTRSTAAEHFVRFGMRAGLSLHPLFELGYFPAHFRDAYKSGNVEATLEYLRSDSSREHMWSPLFDPANLDVGNLARSVLLSKYRPTTSRPLPVPDAFIGEPPVWPDVREWVIRHSAEVYEYLSARKPLRYRVWDGAAEQAWISRLGARTATGDVSQPAVSIVMPVWNRERTVHEAMDSVLAQTLNGWELVVVDDGSTDGTRAVVATYAESDPRIRLIAAEHRGVSASRNTGIDEAKGRFTAFLDSDNTWRADFLRRMTAAMERGRHRAAYAAVRMLNERVEYMGQPVSKLQLLNQNYVDLNVLVVETGVVQSIGGFDTSLRRWVDHDLALRIADHVDIAYFPFIGCDYVDDDSTDRITRTESENWKHAVMGKAVLNWRPPGGEPRERDVAVVIRARASAADAARTVRSLIEQNDVAGDNIVLLDELDGQRESIRLFSSLAGVRGMTYIKMPRSYTPAISGNFGARHARARKLLFVKDGVELRDGAVERMAQVCDDGVTAGCQPLLVDATGIALSAGGVAEGYGPPVALFRGLAIMDAQRAGSRSVDALAPEAFMVRRDTFEALGGYNMIFHGDAASIDLFRRLALEGRGALRVEAEALALHRVGDPTTPSVDLTVDDFAWLTRAGPARRALSSHYEDIGMDVRHICSPRRPRLQPLVPFIERFPQELEGGVPALRWAIKIGASFTTGGDRWGDVPYAADLARALSARDQQVVVDRYGAFARPSNYLDDVVLVIRGLHRCYPQEGKTNVIWVISRPDLVTKEELDEFDLVFIASEPWCRYARESWGIDATYLPQATNPSRFHPQRHAGVPKQHDLVFVGGPRKPIGRKVVADCMAAGFEVEVVGPRWLDYVPERAIIADFVANDEVGALYAQSRIVLNDHFQDMAELGFVNNRLYDAVATGARVLSDKVEGIDRIFHGAVQTYHDAEDLARILNDPAAFPSDDEMLAISEQIRAEHSFERRAGTLLAAVLASRGITRP